MNPQERARWVQAVLREVLQAAIDAPELREALIFKGAWILNLHLHDDRQSMDIDAAAGPEWVGRHPDLAEQETFLGERFPVAVRRRFEHQNPVRYTLDAVRVERSPPNRHPRGWDMFRVHLTISDRQNPGVRALPAATIEVSAPERLGPHAIEERVIGGETARIYSLQRIAGEKLRAYLTSLPAYRHKRGGGEREFRVKDLHDMVRIVRARPTSDRPFWREAAVEFKMACASRFVDCEGPAVFRQEWAQARIRYEQDRQLTRIPFEAVDAALNDILAVFVAEGVFPMSFEAPPLPG